MYVSGYSNTYSLYIYLLAKIVKVASKIESTGSGGNKQVFSGIL